MPRIDPNDLRGLSESLYLYRNPTKSLKLRLQAVLRRNSCPVYPAVPRLIRRFCGTHYVRWRKCQHGPASSCSSPLRYAERSSRFLAAASLVQWSRRVTPSALLCFGSLLGLSLLRRYRFRRWCRSATRSRSRFAVGSARPHCCFPHTCSAASSCTT